MKWNRVILKFVSISFSILVMLLVIVGLIRLGAFCYDFGYRVFTESAVDKKPGRDVVVSVSSDMSDLEVGSMLQEAGLIQDEKLFFAQLKLSAYSGKLQPGVYTLNTSMTGKEMIVVLASGNGEDIGSDPAAGAGADTEAAEEDTEAMEGEAP